MFQLYPTELQQDALPTENVWQKPNQSEIYKVFERDEHQQPGGWGDAEAWGFMSFQASL